MLKLAWFFAIIIYPFLATLGSLLLGFAIHPLAIFVPMLPALALAIREVHRRSKVVMSEAFETSPERWKKAVDEYMALVNFSERKGKSKKSDR